MRILEIILVVYALVGAALLLFGPLGKALHKSVQDSRENESRAALLHDKPMAPEWKFWALGALLGLASWIAWPLLLSGAIASLKPELWTDSLPQRPCDLTLGNMAGTGELSCRACGHTEPVTAFLHGSHDNPWNLTGYQCLQCGKLHAIENALQDSNLSPCECGGRLSREDVLTCPRCRSTELDYHVEFIT